MKLAKTLFAFSAIALLTHTKVFADVGVPIIFPQGGNINVDNQTNVSMESEEVKLEYNTSSIPHTLDCHVSAKFEMKNNSNTKETLTVYFPIGESVFLFGFPDGSEDKVTNFTVDGKLLDSSYIGEITTYIDGKEAHVPAYVWEETFPADNTKELVIEYDTASFKNYSLYSLTYVLTTGSSWKGNIGKGTVEFILPQELPSYAITDLPLIDTAKKSSLPYTVEGNTIKVEFENYEPKSNDIIVIGVGDLELLNEIETLRKKSKTFRNTLLIADKLKTLSMGPHCYFCTGDASEMALDYYNQAIELTTSKEDLMFVLESFIFWHKNGIEEVKSLKDSTLYEYKLQETFGTGECDETKGEFEMQACAGNLTQDRLFYNPLFRTPIFYSAHGVGNKDFLLTIEKRIREYDPQLAGGILKYIEIVEGEIENIPKDPPSEQPSQPPKDTPSPPQSTKNSPLGMYLAITLVGVTTVGMIVTTIWVIKTKPIHKLAQRKPSPETPPKK